MNRYIKAEIPKLTGRLRFKNIQVFAYFNRYSQVDFQELRGVGRCKYYFLVLL